MKKKYSQPEIAIENTVFESSLLIGSGLNGIAGGNTIGDGGGIDNGSHNPDANTIVLWDELEDKF